MPLIRYVTPYSLDGNLADAMNFEVEISPPESYLCFMDRDTLILDPKFGHHINEIIEEHGEAYYTCRTNRTNCEWQAYRNPDIAGNDIEDHIWIADKCKELYGIKVTTHTTDQLWSGHLMICPVDRWVPLKTRGLLGVDNEIHRNAIAQGSRVLLMTGVYLFHWYGGFDGAGGHKKRDKSHLL